ncbi:bifunctional hydroxymethylpyrimidine kinase/phosphomethylpyrimidine kinase [uncultured Limosilactobacillus sp.]|uniref:bifunctional hydroxymethylpyrimidine kinase/phosphomethylpyrimidine kinase n=1 Tax=uncultured Limosilactobacillus sp. TaxID=2837629 RepID=UPI0025FD44F1|nr:bifunctional hydroxymethylpyrimidine kinase/phosphomethylpyrimidine kinase [uncultured Limosilactobacillus sp.]
MKATAVIEDFSALGTISSVAAMDVLHGMGITTAVLPAMFLSSSTEGFGTPVKMTASSWLRTTFAHWQTVSHLDLDSALVGYLGKTSAISEVAALATHNHWQTLLVDPVMGDNGRLYDGFGPDYPAQMMELVKLATVITPNWTELQLLIGEKPIQSDKSDQAIAKAVNKIRQGGLGATIVVTGIHRREQIGSLTFLPHKTIPFFTGNQPFPGHFYGTGDTFSALLVGYLQQGLSMTSAVSKSTAAIQIAVAETAKLSPDDQDRVYGMKTRRLLNYLTTDENHHERLD